MFERRIEEAGLNSWPALQQLFFDGWIIRFAQGYTKRANSVTPLYPSLLTAQEKIAYCERLYTEQQLPTIFRLPSFSTESQQLDQMLAERGYQYLDRTFVWSTQLSLDGDANKPALHALSLETWLPIYLQWSERYVELQHLHRELLEHIASPLIYAALYQQGVPVACGLGVLEHEALGLFDIVTDPGQRRQGYGTQLIKGMLAWGREQGAGHAYLQVVGDNLAAQRMYAKLGFQEAYQYWYRAQGR
ncbi:N-acetyltransferase [Ktedonobacter sp. SOSP1-85]|uniref:GNAT family N-acetyltransferase n=1 Tax=Ktedonobacter sp. SOSP1-85 TaxID=2778367 RepID=UPI0019160FC1|nr:GNAT family N-acetyltransferase [Ktedonobacter sp. SOSP1-85]GHO79147.1 N-acetyltransferase [Ktedonobacter sp. SOSP1-85]